MPGKGESEETDPFQTISFNQIQDIELERIGGFAVSGGKPFRTITLPLIAVDCI